MKRKILKFEKVTDNKWINLFRIKGQNIRGNIVNWLFASRKEDPLNDKSIDAVVIVPIINTPEGKRLVIIKEYRWSVSDFEYGFPAGLVEGIETVESTAKKELKEETGLDWVKTTHISNAVYSSPGLSDEACVMVFVEAEGEISSKNLESAEDIEAFVVDIDGVNDLLQDPNKKIGAKGWGILYYYSKLGRIE